MQQVRLPRARRAAALRDAADGALAVDEDDGAPGRPLRERVVADLDALRPRSDPVRPAPAPERHGQRQRHAGAAISDRVCYSHTAFVNANVPILNSSIPDS